MNFSIAQRRIIERLNDFKRMRRIDILLSEIRDVLLLSMKSAKFHAVSREILFVTASMSCFRPHKNLEISNLETRYYRIVCQRINDLILKFSSTN